jgi:hypothetical protein
MGWDCWLRAHGSCAAGCIVRGSSGSALCHVTCPLQSRPLQSCGVCCMAFFGSHSMQRRTLHGVRRGLPQICDAGGFTVLNVTDPILQRMFDVFRYTNERGYCGLLCGREYYSNPLPSCVAQASLRRRAAALFPSLCPSPRPSGATPIHAGSGFRQARSSRFPRRRRHSSCLRTSSSCSTPPIVCCSASRRRSAPLSPCRRK